MIHMKSILQSIKHGSKNRNTWIMSQFNIGDEDAAYYRISGDDDLNSNGVGKDSVDGLNNYVRYAGARAIAYSPIAGTFHQMPLIPSQIQNRNHWIIQVITLNLN